MNAEAATPAEGDPSWVQQAWADQVAAQQAEMAHGDDLVPIFDAYRSDPRFGRDLYDHRLNLAWHTVAHVVAFYVEGCDARAWQTVMSDALACHLYDLRAEAPPLVDPDRVAQDDAQHWASTASAPELVAFGAAALAQIEKRRLPLVLLKRLLVAIWQRLGEADRRAFIARVDPKGQFR